MQWEREVLDENADDVIRSGCAGGHDGDSVFAVKLSEQGGAAGDVSFDWRDGRAGLLEAGEQQLAVGSVGGAWREKALVLDVG